MAMSKRNPNPNQQLISISKEVLAILQDCLDGTASPLVVKFQSAIAAAESKAGKERCILCNDPIDPKFDTTVADAYVKKGFKPAYAHVFCHAKHQADNRAFAAWCDAKRELEYQRGKKFDKDAMSICGCGHGSLAHEADELDNLLQCEACDCDHFHYSYEEQSEPIELKESEAMEAMA